MKWMLSALVVGFGLSMLLVACGDEEDECVAAATQCVEMQIQTCGDDGKWGATEDCPEGQQCMTMDSGMQHCMAM